MPVNRWLTIGTMAMVAACSSSTGPGGGGGGGHSLTVQVRNNSFSPTPDTVNSAQTVTFTWVTGAVTHNVTFEDNAGNSGGQSSGTHTRNFTTANTYRYRCTIHSTSFTSGMVGQIVVLP